MLMETEEALLTGTATSLSKLKNYDSSVHVKDGLVIFTTPKEDATFAISVIDFNRGPTYEQPIVRYQKVKPYYNQEGVGHIELISLTKVRGEVHFRRGTFEVWIYDPSDTPGSKRHKRTPRKCRFVIHKLDSLLLTALSVHSDIKKMTRANALMYHAVRKSILAIPQLQEQLHLSPYAPEIKRLDDKIEGRDSANVSKELIFDEVREINGGAAREWSVEQITPIDQNKLLTAGDPLQLPTIPPPSLLPKEERMGPNRKKTKMIEWVIWGVIIIGLSVLFGPTLVEVVRDRIHSF